VAVGFRSALSFTNRNNKKRPAASHQSTGTAPLSFLDPQGLGHGDGDEEGVDRNRPPFEYAFALEQDKVRLFSAQSAYLHEREEGSTAAAGDDEATSPRDEYSSLMGSSVRHVVPCSTTKSKSISGQSNDGSTKETPGSGRRGSRIPASARGGASTAALLQPRPLMFWENMVAGAISRSIAQTIMHPANTSPGAPAPTSSCRSPTGP
jgi:hypothetical protein